MKKFLTFISIVILFTCAATAQVNNFNDGFTVQDNSFNPNRAADSLKASHKKIPKGLKVWTIDDRFGDITDQVPDTLLHNFSNYIFTTGQYAEYNTTGNLGAPRISRIATDRDFSPRFAFTEPYGYFVTKPTELRFTNTFSPITNLYYNTCGSDNGEDHIKALFATNCGKELGMGFKFDYVYGRGYYKHQSTALFDYTMWGSYIGERYQGHLLFSFDHLKNAENGGITNDDYILHPEAQSDSYDAGDIPTVLSNNTADNWNLNDAFHLTLSHRYNVGFYRKVPMTEMEKDAKRFALKAQKEKDELKALDDNARKLDNKKDIDSGKPTGRPTGAKIAGELSDSTVNAVKKMLKDKTLADSLIAKKDTAATDTSWFKDVYVPVTSFIHTLHFDNNERVYIAYDTPEGMFLNRYQVPIEKALGDSVHDQINHFSVRNLFAVALHEGLNKYIPMGAKLFISHELRHFVLPGAGDYKYDTYNENNVSIGGQIIKTTGNKLHYNATVEANIIGEDVGNLKIDGTGDVHFRLFKDSISVALKASYHLTNPTFMQRHYHSKFFWWDNDGFNKQMRTHLEGIFSLARTRTTLRVAYDNLQNYVYLAESYNRNTSDDDNCITNYTACVRQSSENISLLTAMLEQNFTYGILNWENRVTFQQSSNNDILPVPTINIWTNLFIDFRIAKVLRVNLGGEMFFFTKYNAPEYNSHLGQYAVQENTSVKKEVGGHPYVNVYANFHLKKCRFFVMMSHVNGSMGSDIFTTPHHPMNTRIFRMGLIWTFFN